MKIGKIDPREVAEAYTEYKLATTNSGKVLFLTHLASF